MPEPGVGFTPFLNSAVTNTAVAVAAYPVRLFYIHVINPNTTDVFIQIFDSQVGDVTVGTTTPKQSWLIPGGTGASNRGAFESEFSWPLQLLTALTIAVTTGPTNSTAPGTAIIVNMGHK